MTMLEDLVIDVHDLDRELAGALLAPYLRIDRATCDIVPLEPWERTSNEGRVLLYLLARRAMRALGLPIGVAASPVEIARATGIPGGSVRPALQRLLRARAIARQERLGYIVPNYALSRAQEYIRPLVPNAAA